MQWVENMAYIPTQMYLPRSSLAIFHYFKAHIGQHGDNGDTAYKSEALTHVGEDKVVGGLGHFKIVAAEKPLAEYLTRAESGLAHTLVIANALRVKLVIEKDKKAHFLIGLHHLYPHEPQGKGQSHNAGQDIFP